MNNDIRILYVEDNEIDTELLLMCFSRYKFTQPIVIDVAETIEEAKMLFDKNLHQLALIDWNLPDGEGIEVAEFIREKHQTLPLFVLSGLLTSSHEFRAKQANVTGYMEKNYNKAFANHIYSFL
ncbi:MAG: response regulator [Nonlabens ulvanivorans]|uniref:response regulator n=1 Tax=Nonlabens ulvanivorans TaxID=906888 RepID=UPI003262F49F